MLSLLGHTNFYRASNFPLFKREYCIRTVFIKNLPWKVSGKELDKAFRKFGKIQTIYAPKSKGGNSKGYAFVRYIVGEPPANLVSKANIPNAEEIKECNRIVEEAVKQMNGAQFKNKILEVEISKSQSFDLKTRSEMKPRKEAPASTSNPD